MALIRCPECKKKISDTCRQCIHCGYTLKNAEEDSDYYAAVSLYTLPEKIGAVDVLLIIGVVIGALLSAMALALFIYVLVCYKQWGPLENEIMVSVSFFVFPVGIAVSVYCKHLFDIR